MHVAGSVAATTAGGDGAGPPREGAAAAHRQYMAKTRTRRAHTAQAQASSRQGPVYKVRQGLLSEFKAIFNMIVIK